jgi:hypothetical protein
MSAIEKPEGQGKNQAEQQTRSQRKIERHTLAAINDVTGQSPQRQMKLAGQEKNDPCQDKNTSHHQQKFSQVDHSTILADGL